MTCNVSIQSPPKLSFWGWGSPSPSPLGLTWRSTCQMARQIARLLSPPPRGPHRSLGAGAGAGAVLVCPLRPGDSDPWTLDSKRESIVHVHSFAPLHTQQKIWSTCWGFGDGRMGPSVLKSRSIRIRNRPLISALPEEFWTAEEPRRPALETWSSFIQSKRSCWARSLWEWRSRFGFIQLRKVTASLPQ